VKSAEANLHASERKPYDSGASVIGYENALKVLSSVSGVTRLAASVTV